MAYPFLVPSSSRPRVVSRRNARAGALGALVVAGLLAPTVAVVAAPVAGASVAHHAPAPALPKVSGGFGTKPKLTFPSTAAPTGLVVKVLHQGHGAVVRSGELVVVNYYGQIWRGKVFDTSWGRGLFGTPIGVRRVIPGWDKGIVGARVGSRLLLSVPPAEGYGKGGNPSGGISGTDTLEFVVDVVGAYAKTAHGDPHATVLHRDVNGVKVGGKLGGKPTVTVAKGAPQPKAVSMTVIARGHGPKITPGLLVDQYVVGAWSGTSPASTWSSVPDDQTIGSASTPNILDKTIGMPLGSRVLFELPKTSSGGGPYAIVVDLVAEPKA